MKEMMITINSIKEAKVLQTAVFKAGGSWPDGIKKFKHEDSKFFYIRPDLKITSSNDELFYSGREEYDTPLSEALIVLDSLIEKQPFLNRSGVKSNLPYKIDSYIKDQYVTLCLHNGIDVTRRIENLIAADIKARIYGKDLIEELKIILK